MKLVPADQVFDIAYGQKLDANKATFVGGGGVNFVSRSSKNLGVLGRVEPVEGLKPCDAGLITVTMGGTYLLSAFIQPEPFYTAQNIKILRPKAPMSLQEKAFYCECIRANRFRYSTHGREANRSFNSLLLPSRDDVPKWVVASNVKKLELREDHKATLAKSSTPKKQALIRLDELFDVRSGLSLDAKLRAEVRVSEDYVPYIRPSKTQTTSFVEFVDASNVPKPFVFPRHSLYVSTNGQGSHTYSYVSIERFVPNSDVSVLLPKRSMSLQEKLYYAAVITSNRFRFSYGRKPKGERLRSVTVPEWAPEFVYSQDLATLVA